MLIFENFRYTGGPQRWTVPPGVAEALFECWGASGGLSSIAVYAGALNVTKGGTALANNQYTNDPSKDAQMGRSFSNNGGYAAGVKTVSEGESYWIFVGGNGGPGHSSIKRKSTSSYYVRVQGGAAGYNGGGRGGNGAHTYQNLYNSPSTAVQYTQTAIPGSATAGQLWKKTDVDKVYRCKKKYASGGTLGTNWEQVTAAHTHLVGPSGGGGGGATDIRTGGSELTNRILVAGGSGGAAGPYTNTGADAWLLNATPDAPAPPFGIDDESTGPRGPNNTWASRVNYFTGGWGRGGLGGGEGTIPGELTTADAGFCTLGGGGSPSSGRHKEGTNPPAFSGAAGKGGGSVSGGGAGSGGTVGTTGVGGNGGNALGGIDDISAGGGGGGGGWFGGGGGGYGFTVIGSSATNNSVSTFGGGAGGGSNYAAPVFRSHLLLGAARPPAGATDVASGANGLGGFARISYRMLPNAQWLTRPRTATALGTFPVTFRYLPAQEGGAKPAVYIVGSAVSPSATFPTTQTTVTITDPDQTEFSYTGFVAPAAAAQKAYFIRFMDADGDLSPWLKQVVTGIAAPTGVVFTAPAVASQFIDSANVTWTIGDQSPLVAYRLFLTGNNLVTGALETYSAGMRPGGSRVNLALDPGFKATAQWSSTSNANMTSQAVNPGVSGSSGKITWTVTALENAEQHTVPQDNFIPGVAYRVAFSMASATATDARKVEFRVEDPGGVLATRTIDFSAVAANTYVPVEMTFTPTGPGVFFRIVPSDTAGTFGNTEASQAHYMKDFLIEVAYSINAVFRETFESGSVTNWTPTNATVAISSEYNTGTKSIALSTTGAAAKITSVTDAPVTPGLIYEARAWGLSSTVSNTFTVGIQFRNAALATVGSLVLGTAVSAPLDSWAEGTVRAAAPATAVWAEVVVTFNSLTTQVYCVDDITVNEGIPAPYFDGTNLNGNTGTVGWSGTTNASASVLTGSVNVLAGTITATDVRLTSGSLHIESLSSASTILGSDPFRVSRAVTVNPSIPATPTVGLVINQTLGRMEISINAADTANNTVYFDIFRNGTRIVTGLHPDPTTRSVTYNDYPAHGSVSTYVVRAFNETGGYADQNDGTVTTT